MASHEQIGYITHLRHKGGLSHEEILDLAEEVTGSPITTLEDLSVPEASELIDKIKEEVGD